MYYKLYLLILYFMFMIDRQSTYRPLIIKMTWYVISVPGSMSRHIMYKQGFILCYVTYQQRSRCYFCQQIKSWSNISKFTFWARLIDFSINRFSLLRALGQIVFLLFSSNHPCQVINGINSMTILLLWWPKWLFWPYLWPWKPLRSVSSVDMPAHLDQFWLIQIVL